MRISYAWDIIHVLWGFSVIYFNKAASRTPLPVSMIESVDIIPIHELIRIYIYEKASWLF